MNKRNDKWGGNIENRFRIVSEIMQQARAKVGKYPIFAKINAYEKSMDGIRREEAVTISRYLEQEGCNGIEVSCGIMEEGFITIRGDIPSELVQTNDSKMKKEVMDSMASPEPHFLYNLPQAEEIKKHVRIPVIVVAEFENLKT